MILMNIPQVSQKSFFLFCSWGWGLGWGGGGGGFKNWAVWGVLGENRWREVGRIEGGRKVVGGICGGRRMVEGR